MRHTKRRKKKPVEKNNNANKCNARHNNKKLKEAGKKKRGKKKNCQTVRTIYGSRKKNCKEKRCQPNVGKFNVTTVGMGRARGSERGNRAGGNMCVPLVA